MMSTHSPTISGMTCHAAIRKKARKIMNKQFLNLREHSWRVPQRRVAVDLQQPGVTVAVDHDVNPEQIKAALR